MALDSVFNGVTFDALVNDPNISVKIGDEIEAASWEESHFDPFLGKSEGRGVRFFTAPYNEPYRPRLRTALTGEGVEGNADISTNLDNINILSQTIYPQVVANGVDSEIDIYQNMKKIDFVKHASDALKTWMLNKRDKMLYAALANDLTNAVVCDSTNGFKDSTSLDSVVKASQQIVKGDTMKVKAIQKAILMAEAGISGIKGGKAFPIKPVKTTKKAENGLNLSYNSYVIFVDSYQAAQLRADPDWKAMQQHAPRNELHRVFTGYLGMIDGCPVVKMGTWTKSSLGLANSTISDTEFKKHIIKQNFGGKIVCPSAYAKTQPVSIGFLIGAGALIMAGSESTRFFINNKLDEGRKTRCSVDRLLAISKGRFELGDVKDEVAQQYVGSDYGVIGIFSSME